MTFALCICTLASGVPIQRSCEYGGGMPEITIDNTNVQNLASIIQMVASNPFLPPTIFDGMTDRAVALEEAWYIMNCGEARTISDLDKISAGHGK